MKLFRIAALVVAVSATTGCATVKGWFNGDKVDEAEAAADVTFVDKVTLPDGYAQPKKSEEFDIPAGDVDANDAYVTSPSSVLAIFEGSWINEDDPHPVKIMLERPELVKNFPQFVASGVDSFAKDRGLTVEKTATGYRVNQIVTTETGFWFWKSQADVEAYSYDLNIQFKPHGRSGEVSVETVSYEKLNKELATKLSPDLRETALAIQSLNDFMLELDYLYRVELKEEQASLDVSLALGKDVAGNHVIVSQQEISYVWSQIDDLVEELGFSIENEDDDLYIMDLTYDPQDTSFWDSLFSSVYSDKLDIESGEYELVLTTTTKGVHIKFRTKAGKMFDQDEVGDVYKLLKAIVEDEELEL